MTKKQRILMTLAQLCGPKRAWKSQFELVQALGWADSVSPLLNRLVAEGKVEQMEWMGEGAKGRLCNGYRPVKEKKADLDTVPAVLAALGGLDEVRVRLAEIAQALRDATGAAPVPPFVVSS